jgi:hypothetical protein
MTILSRFRFCHPEARGIPASANGLVRVGCFLRQHDIRINVNRFVIPRQRGIPARANGLVRVGCFLRQHDNCISFSVLSSQARGIPASANGLVRVGCFLRQHDNCISFSVLSSQGTRNSCKHKWISASGMLPAPA